LRSKIIFKKLLLFFFLILSCNETNKINVLSSENNCSIKYENVDLVIKNNKIIIFDGSRPSPRYFYRFSSYEIRKNILYINLDEIKENKISKAVVSYPCIIFETKFNPKRVIVNIKKKYQLNKEYKKSTNN
tara:strand:+ start:2287 stop:2679 length:393 start_codon:yes stop_codon:yes gene_type:complete